jgi:hypothetical protein
MAESTAASIPTSPEQPAKHRLARIVAWRERKKTED